MDFNTVMFGIILLIQGGIFWVYKELNKSNKEIKKNYKDMLSLYEPEKTLKNQKAFKEYYEELNEVEIKKAVDKVKASLEGGKKMSDEDVKKLVQSSISKTAIKTCELIIEKEATPERIISVVKKNMEQLEKNKNST